MNTVQKHGLVVHRIPVSHDPDEMLAFPAVSQNRTKLLARQPRHDRQRHPAPQPPRWHASHPRKGGYVFFDGAHAAGQFPVDVHYALGCHFYGMVGYKWLMGPYHSAALYINRDTLDEIDVTWTGSGATRAASVTMGPGTCTGSPAPNASSTRPHPLHTDTAMVPASLRRPVGVEAVEAHARHLTDYSMPT
jgi:selenocysteine lyase/cysteine desulfurase